MNVALFRIINNWGKALPWLDPIAVFFAKYAAYLIILFLIIYWFTRKKENRMMVFCAVISFILATILGRIAGMFHQNFQPFYELQNVNQLIKHAVDNSFPSDHTLMSFSICTTFWLFRKRFRNLWILLAICISLSRIIVGVHYPFDVCAGVIIGIVVSFFVYKIVPRISFIQKLLDFYEKMEAKILPRKD